jgi:hypothetical protein
MGRDIPPELFELPAGRYVVESVEEAPPLAVGGKVLTGMTCSAVNGWA